MSAHSDALRGERVSDADDHQLLAGDLHIDMLASVGVVHGNGPDTILDWPWTVSTLPPSSWPRPG